MLSVNEILKNLTEFLNSEAGPITKILALSILTFSLLGWVVYDKFFNEKEKFWLKHQ